MVISMKPWPVMACRRAGDHLAAQDNIVLHLGVAQIQVAELEPLGFVGLPAAVHGKGSSLWRQRPSTSIFAGTTSMSPVGSLGFLLSRSRTVPGDLDGGLLVEGPKVFTSSSLFHTT